MKKTYFLLFAFAVLIVSAIMNITDTGAAFGIALASAPLAIPDDIKAKAQALLQALAGDPSPEATGKALNDLNIKDGEVSAVIEAMKALNTQSTKADFNISVPKFNKKYDHVPTDQLSLSYELASKMSAKGDHVKGFNRFEMVTEIEGRFGSDEFRKENPEGLKTFNEWKARAGVKSGEIQQSTLANYGDEWVGQGYVNEIWNKVRLSSDILADIPTQTIQQGVEGVSIPLESTDLTFYRVAQAADAPNTAQPVPTIPPSKMGTAKKDLSVGTMAARALYTYELTEDAIIAFASQLQTQAIITYREYMESLLLDGDTATGATTNINHIGGTPATSDYFLISDGARKNALATAGNYRSGTTLAASDFLATRKLLGVSGVDAKALKFIVDAGTYFNAVGLTEVKTMDVFGNDATIATGNLSYIYGVPLRPSAQICKMGGGLSNANGKVDQTTPANNTKGTILLIRADQWRLAMKRAMTIEYTRFANALASEFVIHTRAGVGARGTQGAAAITYGLTI